MEDDRRHLHSSLITRMLPRNLHAMCAADNCGWLTPHALAQVFARRKFALRSSTVNRPRSHQHQHVGPKDDGAFASNDLVALKFLAYKKILIAPKFCPRCAEDGERNPWSPVAGGGGLLRFQRTCRVVRVTGPPQGHIMSKLLKF